MEDYFPVIPPRRHKQDQSRTPPHRIISSPKQCRLPASNKAGSFIGKLVKSMIANSLYDIKQPSQLTQVLHLQQRFQGL